MRPTGIFRNIIAGAITEHDCKVTPVDENIIKEAAFLFCAVALWHFVTLALWHFIFK